MGSRNTSLIPTIGLVIILGLAGCAGAIGTGNAPASTTTDGAGDVASGRPVDETDKKGIWVLTEVEYPTATSTCSLNAKGDVIKEVSTVTEEGTDDTVNTTSFSYDADGHLSEVESETDGKRKISKIAVDVDKNGNVVSERESGKDGAERTYEYDEHGHLRKMTHKAKGFTAVRKYEDGLLVSKTDNDGYAAAISYMRDQRGTPISAAIEIDSDLGHEEYEVTYEMDANGNVSKATTKTIAVTDKEGKAKSLSKAEDVVLGYKYEFVEDPSPDAKAHAQQRLADVLVHE